MANFINRKPNRLNNFDYNSNGIYAVTFCTKNRECILSIVGAVALDRPQIILSEIGKILDSTIVIQNKSGITIQNYVIMPNHVHLLICIDNCRRSGATAPTIQQVVKNIKSFVTKKVGRQIWQKGFHDRIIRNDCEHQSMYDYINFNPSKWLEDKYFSDDLL